MSDGRYYEKDNPEYEPLGVAAHKPSSATSFGENVTIIPNAEYTKPDAKALPNAYIVIFSGGTTREKDYFRLIRNNPSLYPKIKINFIAEPGFEQGGKPSIINLAVNKTHEYRESVNTENPDSFFLLTDVDHFEPFLTEMKEECNHNGIELIVSNSCFEVWLYYSERSDKCVGFMVPDHKHKISAAFKTWANEQIKGGLKPTKAILNIEQNMANAKSNYLEENGLPTLFSTQMYRLAEKILPYVEEGNAKILSELGA